LASDLGIVEVEVSQRLQGEAVSNTRKFKWKGVELTDHVYVRWLRRDHLSIIDVYAWRRYESKNQMFWVW
jgi:hypothetical protein